MKDPNHYGKGTSDGAFQSLRYFTCKHNCGLFVSLDKLYSQQQPPTLLPQPPAPAKPTEEMAKVTK